MASAFDAEFAAATNDDFLTVFGETLAVIPAGHTQRNISVIVLRETRRPVENGGVLSNRYNAMNVQISSRNDVEGIVSPKEVHDGGACDVFPSIDGKSWTLQRVLEWDTGGMHLLELWDGGSGL